jgi:hypothetical protein
MMVQHLMAKKKDASDDAEAVQTAKPQKMVHVRLLLINCLFSDELSSNSNSSNRAALNAGAVGSNSYF